MTEEDVQVGWQRAGSIAHVAPEHAPEAWVVENVATLPEFRRRGLVERLLAEILDRGRIRKVLPSRTSVAPSWKRWGAAGL
jgi:ribosomal protein S18 acetylase RimI-like enzyme